MPAFETLIEGQLISKANFLESKTQRNYFLISALASKKRSDEINKGTLSH